MTGGQPIPFEARTKMRIPLASASVQAGFPSPAEDHMENSLDLNDQDTGKTGQRIAKKTPLLQGVFDLTASSDPAAVLACVPCGDI